MPWIIEFALFMTLVGLFGLFVVLISLGISLTNWFDEGPEIHIFHINMTYQEYEDRFLEDDEDEETVESEG